MAVFVYEPQYKLTGWADDGGMTLASWFDRDLTSDSSGTIIKLVRAEPILFVNANVIYAPPPITVEVLPTLFVNENMIFAPTFARAVGRPDQMIKNEVRRVR
jgi:hypothetical protein